MQESGDPQDGSAPPDDETLALPVTTPPASPFPAFDAAEFPYRIDAEVGRGGQGIVYRACDPTLNRSVAIKMLTDHALLFPTSIERLRREAEAAAKVQHPGICPILATGVHRGRPWIAMAWLEGETLERRLDREPVAGAVNPRALLAGRIALVERLARALHAAHDRNVIHRDIKPSNVMIVPEEHPVILDFGLARDLDLDATRLTESGMAPGTLAYMSPEQLGGAPLDRRTDIYSLGVVLFECAAGRRPFDGAADLRGAIRNGAASDPRDVNPAITRDLAVVIAKAMAPAPQDRYASAADLADDLLRILQRKPIRARPLGPVRRFLRWSERNRALSSAIVLLFATLLAAATIFLLLYRRNAALLEKNLYLLDAHRLRTLEAELREIGVSAPDAEERLATWIAAARDLLSRRDRHEEQGSGGRVGSDSDRLALAELLDGLRSLEDASRGALPRALRRLEQARRLVATSLRDGRGAWDDARERIADGDRYPLFVDLEPDAGLHPLGPDPSSGLEEFAAPGTGDLPTRDPDSGKLRIPPRSSVIFVLLPGGAMRLGEGPDTPPHDVTLDPFLIAKHELSLGQWRAIQRLGDIEEPADGELTEHLKPVSTQDVARQDLIAALRRMRCTLPTEAQWEHACRGDDRRSWRDRLQAIVPGRDAVLESDRALPIGGRPPNDFGLHDIWGNLAELCLDAVASEHLAPRPGDGLRPPPPRLPPSANFLARGGHFASPRTEAADRFHRTSPSRSPHFGCRPVWLPAGR